MRVLTFFLLSLCLLSASCQKDELQSQVAGRWKLIEVQTVFSPQSATYDYSDNNIIFRFRGNGTLDITSDLADFSGFQTGTFSYTLTDEPLHSFLAGTMTLTIDPTGLSYACTISGNELVIDASFVDGPILKLVRTP